MSFSFSVRGDFFLDCKVNEGEAGHRGVDLKIKID